jgi:glycosyltransferase involved in cell wall biosynthesis
VILTDPLVSIVVPSYNHGRFIGKMIDSVMNQSFTNWELIIIDNHSSDNTDLVLNEYSDNRIRVVKINNYGIVAISRNKGIKEAKGLWIAFLDSDDGWHPNKLENCLAHSENADLVYHDMQLYKADIDKILDKDLKSRKLVSPIIKDLLIRGNTLINSSVFVRKELLDHVSGLNEDKGMITAEDYHLWLKIAKRTNRFVYVPEQMGFYAIHGQGLSQRDTSSQLRKAVSEFLPMLNKKEQKQVESFIRYSKIRTMVNTGKIETYINDFFYCFWNGTFDNKLKSVFSLFELFYLDFKNKF